MSLNIASRREQVAERPGRGVEVAGAREVRVTTLEEAVAVLTEGAKHRMTAATLMNQASSRSHSIFMLRLDQVQLFCWWVQKVEVLIRTYSYGTAI